LTAIGPYSASKAAGNIMFIVSFIFFKHPVISDIGDAFYAKLSGKTVSSFNSTAGEPAPFCDGPLAGLYSELYQDLLAGVQAEAISADGKVVASGLRKGVTAKILCK